MGTYSSDVSLLEGRVITRINVEAGIVEFELEDGDIYAIMGVDNGVTTHAITLIEGDMEHLIDSPVEVALYDIDDCCYLVETFFGEVRFTANGSETGFFQAAV